MSHFLAALTCAACAALLVVAGVAVWLAVLLFAAELAVAEWVNR